MPWKGEPICIITIGEVEKCIWMRLKNFAVLAALNDSLIEKQEKKEEDI